MRGCRPLTDPEIARVVAAFSGRHELRDRAFFMLGLKTGLRCQELLGLRLRDVWRDRVLERVEVARSITKGKCAGFSVPIHPRARDFLALYIETSCQGLPANAPLFRSGKAGFVGLRALDRSSAWRRIKAAFRIAGVEGRTGTHSLRKTYCERVYRALGHDLVRTRIAMRHRSIMSTIRYLSFDVRDIEAAILAL